MRALLRIMPPGVPVECLLARIKGRKSFLVSDWDRVLLTGAPLTSLAAAPWRPGTIAQEEGLARQALQREYLWVFRQLPESLRNTVTPFFWLAEVSTLATCLRSLAGGRHPDEDVLRDSLLSNDIKSLLRDQTNAVAAVTVLAERLATTAPRFSGLPEIFRHGGSGALEAALYDYSLETFTANRLHPRIGRYITLLIDCRNLVAIDKQLRWRIHADPQLLPGGTIRTETLQELFSRKNDAGLATLAGRLAARSHDAGQPEALERMLLESQGVLLCRMAREADSVGTILDYLWRCNAEARNIGLLAQMGIAGIDAVSMELHR